LIYESLINHKIKKFEELFNQAKGKGIKGTNEFVVKHQGGKSLNLIEEKFSIFLSAKKAKFPL